MAIQLYSALAASELIDRLRRRKLRALLRRLTGDAGDQPDLLDTAVNHSALISGSLQVRLAARVAVPLVLQPGSSQQIPRRERR
jgi:hypothetical protein